MVGARNRRTSTDARKQNPKCIEVAQAKISQEYATDLDFKNQQIEHGITSDRFDLTEVEPNGGKIDLGMLNQPAG